MRFLAGYSRRAVIDEFLIPVVREAADGPVAIMDLERSVAAHRVVVRPVILHLLWTGELVADLDRPLDVLSVVAPRESLKAGQA